MAATLETALKALHSKEAKLDFLRKIYKTGNTDAAEKILALEDNLGVINAELSRAMGEGDKGKVSIWMKRRIDCYARGGYDSLISGDVIDAKDPALADYALEKLENWAPERDVKNVESPLRCAADIAEAFGRKDKRRELLEKLLKIQLKTKKEYSFTPAGTCEKLGRYDKAIELYVRAGGNWIESALDVAKKHAPKRVKEIAEKGFREFNRGDADEELYVGCAEILGRTEEAKKALVVKAKGIKEIDPYPRVYQSLVDSLVKLGCRGVAKELVARVAKKQDEVRDDKCYSMDLQKELADLFVTVGDKDSAAQAYLTRVEKGLKDRWHPSTILEDIDRGFKATGNPVFLEKKVLAYELDGNFGAAAKLARKLGKNEQAEAYDVLQRTLEAGTPKTR